MNDDIKKFALEYAKTAGISPFEAGTFVGALQNKAIQKTDNYKLFVIALGTVAPQLLQLNNILEKANES